MVTRDQIGRQLLCVDNTRLSVRGFLIDQLDGFVKSRFLGYDNDHQNLRDYSVQQMNSSIEANQNEGRQIKRWLSVYDKTKDETMAETTFQDGGPSIFLASLLEQRYRIDTLYQVNKLCLKKLPTTSRSLNPESWLTFIWRDLLEGHSTLVNISEEDFNEQFYDLAQSEKSVSGGTWLSNTVRGKVRTVRELPQLDIPLRELFQSPKTFFTTERSGCYGISPRGVQKGDKLAFLFPPIYMTFILRPSGEYFQTVGPYILPPRLRDIALKKLCSLRCEEDKFVIV